MKCALFVKKGGINVIGKESVLNAFRLMAGRLQGRPVLQHPNRRINDHFTISAGIVENRGADLRLGSGKTETVHGLEFLKQRLSFGFRQSVGDYVRLKFDDIEPLQSIGVFEGQHPEIYEVHAEEWRTERLSRLLEVRRNITAIGVRLSLEDDSDSAYGRALEGVTGSLTDTFGVKPDISRLPAAKKSPPQLEWRLAPQIPFHHQTTLKILERKISDMVLTLNGSDR